MLMVRALAYMVFACLALLSVSCETAERSPNADEKSSTPEAPRSSAPAAVPEDPDVVLVVLVELDDADEVATWTTVNDPGRPWSYIHRFSTEAAVQRTYELPIEGFQPVGMRLDPEPNAPENLDPSSISQVSFYILDKQQGPFELAISAIEATA